MAPKQAGAAGHPLTETGHRLAPHAPATPPPVRRRREPGGGLPTSPRAVGHRRSRSRRGRRRSAWEQASSASSSEVLAGFVLVMAAIAWLVTFYFVLTFVW